MVVRFLIRILANNEQLVQKLSESYPIRRAAQIIVRAFYHGKYFVEEQGLNRRITPEEFRRVMKQIADNVQGQLKQAQDTFQKKMKQ